MKRFSMSAVIAFTITCYCQIFATEHFSAPNSQSYSLDETSNILSETLQLGFPVIDIVTVDGEQPTCEYVASPEGCVGSGITNATKVPGSVRRYELDGTVSYNSGDYLKGESGMTLKIRGNTSAYQERKPYKIKLQKKADLLARNDKKYNDKNWLLLNDYYLLTRIGFWVNELIGMPWTPQCEYVNVILNGEYWGMYLLCEAVERNTDCRIDVSKTGFVTELDAYWWNEDGYLPSGLSPYLNYTMKYPEYEDLTAETNQYITEALVEYENSIAEGTYDSYIDCDSFAAWVMGQDILGIYDGMGSNMYYAKYDDTYESKIFRPTMWDFDSCEKTPDRWTVTHTDMHKNLFNNINPEFSISYARVWQNKGKDVFDEVVNRINEFKQSPEVEAFDRSITATNKRWNSRYPLSDHNITRSTSWYIDRKKWMANAMKEFDEYSDIITGIETPSLPAVKLNITGRIISTDDDPPLSVYCLDGRKVAFSSTGSVELTDAGLYIVVHHSGTEKIAIK